MNIKIFTAPVLSHFMSIALLFATAMASIAFAGIVIQYSPIPFWDMWNGTVEIVARIDEGDLGAWIELHNEHRIIISRLLFWLDEHWFGGRNIFLFSLNFLFMALVAAGLWVAARALPDGPGEERGRIILFLLTVGWLFSWAQAVNFTWAFQSQFFLAQALPLLSLVLFAQYVKHGKLWQIALAVLLGVLAAGTMANGVLALPLILLLSLLLPVGWRVRALLLVLSVVIIGLYFQDYVPPRHHGSPIETLISLPVMTLVYTFGYIGNSFHWLVGGGAVGKVLAPLAGAFLTLTALILTWREIPKRRPMVIALLGFLAFVGATALATAGGRLVTAGGMDTAYASRYATPGVIAWAVLGLLLWQDGGIRIPCRLRSVAPIALLSFLVVLIAQQTDALESKRGIESTRELAALALGMGVADEPVIRRVYFSPERGFDIAQVAQERGLFLYGYRPYDAIASSMGQQSSIPEPVCRGNMGEPEVLAGSSEFRKVRGWMHGESDHSQPRLVKLIRASDRRVVGLAFTGTPRKDVADVVGRAASQAGFRGYVRADMADEALLAVSDSMNCHFRARN